MLSTSSTIFSEQKLHTSDGSVVRICFTSTGAGNLGLHVGTDLRATLDNRRFLENQLLGSEVGSGFIYLNQVHGVDVIDADSLPAGDHHAQPHQILEWAPCADAASSSEGAPLAVMVADCIPVIFVGEHAQDGRPITGVAHAGRRGLLDGVLQREVEDLLRRGARNLKAWLGPSICGKCYEVSQEMCVESVKILPELESQTHKGTPALDLPAGARSILRNLLGAGFVYEHLAACTFENPLLYSHRGHINRGEPAGRFAGLVWTEQKSRGKLGRA